MKILPSVYIVRCADGTLYTGYAKDVELRCKAHNAGRGAKYTAGRRPVELVYRKRCRSVGDALKREFAIKQLSRPEKEALITAARRRRRAPARTIRQSRTLLISIQESSCACNIS